MPLPNEDWLQISALLEAGAEDGARLDWAEKNIAISFPSTGRGGHLSRAAIDAAKAEVK